MRILLTNDDGINAPGLIALHKVLAEIDPIPAEAITAALAGPPRWRPVVA